MRIVSELFKYNQIASEVGLEPTTYWIVTNSCSRKDALLIGFIVNQFRSYVAQVHHWNG